MSSTVMGSNFRKCHTTKGNACISGFALPSVLFLITILSFLSLAIVSTQYFRQKVSLYKIAGVKSHLAATNGIAWSIAQKNTTSKQEYDDQSGSETELLSWGFYKLAHSKGIYRRTNTEYSALVGEKQKKGMKSALLFTNPEHQLIFSGNAQIIGDVEVGLQGVSIGTIPQYPSPRKIPVQGRITRKARSASVFSFKEVLQQIGRFDQQINSGYENKSSSNLALIRDGSIDVSAFDTGAVREVQVKGDAVISGTFHCRGNPLQIIVHGNVTFSSMKRTSLSGPIQVLASGRVTIPASVGLENAIIYSRKAIEVQSGARINAQLFSPQISINTNVTLHYPSALFAFRSEKDTTTTPRMIRINEGSQIQGFVAMNESRRVLNDLGLIIIRPSATVIGYMYTDEAMTMEGSVYGTVIAKDFYFYQSPTRYLGWLKEGLIDRTGLPEDYLLPVGFNQGTSEWEVLEWL